MVLVSCAGICVLTTMLSAAAWMKRWTVDLTSAAPTQAGLQHSNLLTAFVASCWDKSHGQVGPAEVRRSSAKGVWCSIQWLFHHSCIQRELDRCSLAALRLACVLCSSFHLFWALIGEYWNTGELKFSWEHEWERGLRLSMHCPSKCENFI